MADATDGGSDWEVVSLTASTYAAAPGPIPVPIDAAADKTERNPPAPHSHFFMSQHFNLPLFGTHLENINGGQELQESGPALPVTADPIIPCPENYCQILASPAGGNGLPVDGGGGGGGGGGDQVQQTTTVICSLPDATAGADATADGSASLPPPAATVPVAAPSGGVGGQAWWEKTFSFPRQDGNGNGTQPLAFRFVFVAGKLQLQEQDNHLCPVPEFGVHGHAQNIGCAVTEPLGEVKGSMLGGGSPVAQQG